MSEPRILPLPSVPAEHEGAVIVPVAPPEEQAPEDDADGVAIGPATIGVDTDLETEVVVTIGVKFRPQVSADFVPFDFLVESDL